MRLLEEMKVTNVHPWFVIGKSTKQDHNILNPDIVTNTTPLKLAVCFLSCHFFILQRFGDANDLLSLEANVLEMKLRHDLSIDWTAFIAITDALLNCGSMNSEQLSKLWYLFWSCRETTDLLAEDGTDCFPRFDDLAIT